MSIGTKTVDKIAHLEVAEVISRFKKAVSTMMPKSVTPEGIPRLFKNSAPDTASKVPIPE